MYENKDRQCECYKCEFNTTCPYVDKYQRLGREHKGALGLCKKLEENQRKDDKHNGWIKVQSNARRSQQVNKE